MKKEQNKFEKNNIKLNHYYGKITAEIKGTEYLLINKIALKIDYKDELNKAYELLKEKGVI
jgi:hypothetical protein